MSDLQIAVDAAREVVRQVDAARYSIYDHAEQAAHIAVAAAFATFATQLGQAIDKATPVE